MPVDYGRKQLDPEADPLDNIGHAALGEHGKDTDFGWLQEFRRAARDRPGDAYVERAVGRLFLEVIASGDSDRMHRLADHLAFAVQNEQGAVNDFRGYVYARYAGLRFKATQAQRQDPDLDDDTKALVDLIRRHESESKDSEYVTTQEIRDLDDYAQELRQDLQEIDDKDKRTLAKRVGMRFRPRRR